MRNPREESTPRFARAPPPWLGKAPVQRAFLIVWKPLSLNGCHSSSMWPYHKPRTSILLKSLPLSMQWQARQCSIIFFGTVVA